MNIEIASMILDLHTHVVFHCSSARIHRLFLHEDYDKLSALKYNDVALIQLTEPLVFNDYIRPLCLPTSGDTVWPSPNSRCFTAGWGYTNLETGKTIAPTVITCLSIANVPSFLSLIVPDLPSLPIKRKMFRFAEDVPLLGSFFLILRLPDLF